MRLVKLILKLSHLGLAHDFLQDGGMRRPLTGETRRRGNLGKLKRARILARLKK